MFIVALWLWLLHPTNFAVEVKAVKRINTRHMIQISYWRNLDASFFFDF